ncbi:DUF4019 domain-containing protein [Salinisphaera sp. G21_0]|uniref:DUF4019 domain-containing protein n=1 Tax=Salinisphaera sp. G21_0 TaxID=2821094 RepID=UPI001ADAE34E|nr:DUF4019 domain-containing protein [Salinisphaera sp. G21_0]MBO9482642.1 DUF4019 domain-containing protein [Salinisphaera sp. G21_0]
MKWVTVFLMSVCSTLVYADSSLETSTEWLTLLDAMAYRDGWNAASPFLQSQVTEYEWATSVQAVRNPLGALTARHLITSTDHHELAAVPDGQYRILTFKSSFENKATAIETVVLSKGTGQWLPAGYFIK